MKLGILIAKRSRDNAGTNIDRLEQAGRERGHEMVRIYEAAIRFSPSTDGIEAMYEDQSLRSFEALIYRPNFVEEPGLHAHTLELLAQCGVRVMNGQAQDIGVTKNKLLQHARFAAAGIPLPRWAITQDGRAARAAAEQIGFPLMIKTAFGMHGTGVFYAENWETFLPIAEYLSVRDNNPILLEECITYAERKDLRLFVVGGRIVAAMERAAREGDMRANASIGGTGRVVELTEEEKTLALKTAALFHLEILGIDILRSERGPLVIEVNANPGFETLEKVTSVNVAGAIIDEITRQ